jgi:hypothetical protein
MMTNVTLKLDHEAIQALFPEGSEVRVQLQNHILSTAAKQFVKGALTDDMREYLRTLVAATTQELDYKALVAEYFQGGHLGPLGKVHVPDGSPLATALADAARKAFRDNVVSRVTTLISELSAEYEAGLDQRVTTAVEGALDLAERREFERRIHARVAEFLSQAPGVSS